MELLMRSMVRFGDYRVVVEPPTPGFPAGSARVLHALDAEHRSVVVADNFDEAENLRCARAWLELHRSM